MDSLLVLMVKTRITTVVDTIIRVTKMIITKDKGIRKLLFFLGETRNIPQQFEQEFRFVCKVDGTSISSSKNRYPEGLALAFLSSSIPEVVEEEEDLPQQNILQNNKRG